jgi:hypothetical protein
MFFIVIAINSIIIDFEGRRCSQVQPKNTHYWGWEAGKLGGYNA